MATEYCSTKSKAPQGVSARRSAARSRKLPAVLRHYKALRGIEKALAEADELLSPADWQVVLQMLNNERCSDEIINREWLEKLEMYELE
jgi:hypothetical protein